MENLEEKRMINRSGSYTVGILIIVLGLGLLLKNLYILPYWLFRWHTFLIVLGVFIGSKSNFKNNSWLVILLIGVYFTLNEALSDYGLSHIIFPIMLLLIGFYLIAKPKQSKFFNFRSKNNAASERNQTDTENQNTDGNTDFAFNADEFVTSVNVFGASQQVVYSKNIKGGELTSVFGGCDINFIEADFDQEIIINVTAVFGGIKLVLPPNWHVRSEVSAVFGGVEDKRRLLSSDQNPNKTLIIRGLVMFGGLELKSF